MTKSNIEDLIETAKNKKNERYIRMYALTTAKSKIEKLSKELAKIEWGMK